MSGTLHERPNVTPVFQTAAPSPTKKRTTLSPFTLRLTCEERARLEERAGKLSLGAYLHACVFSEDTKSRKLRTRDVVKDKKAAAEALALLGQPRIASNLNQLAYHANVGALIVGPAEKEDIAETNAHLAAIRSLLMEALGKKKKPPASRRRAASSGSNGTEDAASCSARTRP